jgi:hypothetical protein
MAKVWGGVTLLCLCYAATIDALKIETATRGGPPIWFSQDVHRPTNIGRDYINVTGGLTVGGAVRGDAIVTKSAKVGKVGFRVTTLETNVMNVGEATSMDTEVGTLRSPTGSILLKGHLQVSGSIKFADAKDDLPNSPMLLQTDDELQAATKPNIWRLVSADTFDVGTNSGWSLVNGSAAKGLRKSGSSLVSHCGDKNHFLGGHCSASGHEMTKVFRNLPVHSQVRVRARFHFLDQWDGESAYMKVNKKYVWTDVHDSMGDDDGAINLCGGDAGDGRMAVPVNVVVEHTDSTLEVAFGSSLDEHACEESWGVDDVELLVR